MTDKEGIGRDSGLDRSEKRDVQQRQRLRPAAIYQTVRNEGEEELKRAMPSLWWSGLAGGFGISLSLFVMSLLRLHLPDASWAPLVESMGYTAGFLVVVIGRLQLFTESTITPVLPLISHYSNRSLYIMLRLWATVLLANLVGTLIVALLAVHANLGTEEQLRASVEVASKVLEKTFAEAFMMGIPAGFIVALIVWLLPSARGQEFFVVIAFSYIIALGEFTHVVVDSAKVFLLGFADEEGGWRAIYGQLLPTLIGNIIGGTVLFSMLAYGQVRREIGGDRGQ